MTMTKTKPKGRPFKKFYCDRDEVFLLPPLAFKLWMFYYRLESAKREGWASRNTICKKCAMNKDSVSKWRKWLVENGWMKQIGTHNTGSEFGIPVMQVTRGNAKATPKAGRKKGFNPPRPKRSVTTVTDANSHGSALIRTVNRLANAFGVAVGESPAVTFKAIAEQVNGEVGKVVAGGTPHEAELVELRSNLNSDQSPDQTKKVIRAYVNLMAGRITEINERSQQYFNRDVKGVSPTTAKVFNKYGVPAPGQVAATVNGVTGFIPKNQVTAFKQKFPNATIGGQ